MKCSDCDFEADNAFLFAYADIDKQDEPSCMNCILGAIERRMRKVENTLHKKSCILCGGKEYANNLFSIMSAPTKLICRSCVTILAMNVDKEKKVEVIERDDRTRK